MNTLLIAERLMVGLLVFIVLVVALDFALEAYQHEWRPRMCLAHNGSIVYCPAEFGGLPPLPENVSMNWSNRT